MADAVELTIAPRTRPVGSGEVRRLLPHRSRRMVGPFIFADLMGPEHLPPGVGTDVDAHPHIGLSTLSWLFDGEMVHRDSLGSVEVITPGAVNWMTAGRGVCHTERSTDGARTAEATFGGLQTWVALPADAEDMPPTFEHCDREDVPVGTDGGARIRLAAGTGWGMQAPVTGSSPLVLAEIDVDGTTSLPDDHAERAVVCVAGELALDGHLLPEAHLVVLRPGREPRLSGSGRAMLLGGEPIGERHIWWNFVSSDPDRIESAKRDWEAQRFPEVPGDHDPWVPLPG